MNKNMGTLKTNNTSTLESPLNLMISEASADPAYSSPFIRTAIITTIDQGSNWDTAVELAALPNPVSLSEYVKRLNKLIALGNLGITNTMRELDLDPNNNYYGAPTDGLGFTRSEVETFMRYVKYSCSVEHQPSSGTTVRCSISMTKK